MQGEAGRSDAESGMQSVATAARSQGGWGGTHRSMGQYVMRAFHAPDFVVCSGFRAMDRPKCCTEFGKAEDRSRFRPPHRRERSAEPVRPGP